MMPLTRGVAGREPFHGVRQIVRFNWPFYAVGTGTVLLSPPVVSMLPLGVVPSGVAYAGAALACLWLVGSLAASWLVYDHSPLMAGTWIRDALGFRPRSWINIHSGFDELTPALRTRFKRSHGRTFDIYDPIEMTASSIVRARHSSAGHNDEAADFHHLPAGTSTADAVLLPLSAHELRTHAARRALFDEIHRVLMPGGRVVVAEHLRDVPNFVAFGPGFLHFHSRRTWTRCFAEARFGIYDEFSITPFVRVFILRRLP